MSGDNLAVVPFAYPGAVRIANLLLILAGLIVIFGVFAGAVAGAADDNFSTFVLTALAGAIAGGLLFTNAYMLLLLNRIEFNTRIVARGDELEG